MKEFNLELAKAGHPLQTRDGRAVRILCYDRKSKKNNYPIVALVEIQEGEEDTYWYTIDGYYHKNKREDKLDLFMASPKKEGWINIYKSFAGTRYCGNIYSSEEEAINHVDDYGDTHLNTNKIEWEE